MQLESRRENEKEYSDMEEIDQESDTSDSDSDSSSSSSSSDLNGEPLTTEEECIRRKQSFVLQMSEMEKRVVSLQDYVHKAKLRRLDEKLIEIHHGEAKEYVQPLTTLKENLDIKLETSAKLEELRRRCIINAFQCELQAAKQDFKNDRNTLFDMYKKNIEDKIRALEEDRHNVNLTADLWFAERSLRSARKKYVRQPKDHNSVESSIPKRKVITVSGPYIVYRLRESEILEDWAVIKKALVDIRRKVFCK